MSYGTLKVDNITYTEGGADASISVSGLVEGQFPDITITGTISGATITGNAGDFTTITAVTGIFTTSLSGATVTGNVGQFTNIGAGGANFTSVTGTTITGGTANINNGNFTGTLSGATVTGNIGQFIDINAAGGNFTSVTGATITGTTVNAVSANFTTSITGVTITGTTANFVSGNYTDTLSGATTVDSKGNVRSIPQNSQSSGYTLVAADAGKHVVAVSGVTVPSGILTVGDAVSIFNNTTGNITITQASGVTLRQAGASGTGDRTLAQFGLATVLCVSGTPGTVFVIGGAGIS
jgi:hypothetical protein